MILSKRIYCLLIAIACFATEAFAQKPIGSWQSYLPYNSAVGLATGDNAIFVAANEGFFIFHPLTGQWEPYSKVEGMSDIGTQCVGYDAATGTAILVYTDGNIDLYKDYTFYNIPDLKLKSVSGTKQVYQVYTENGMAYLSSSLGVIVIDMAAHTIPATYQFITQASPGTTQTLSVKSFQAAGNYFYAATNGGLYRVNKNSPELQNFQIWDKIDSTHAILNMAVVNNVLFLSDTTHIYRIVNDTLHQVYASSKALIHHIDAGITQLFIGEYNPSVIRIMDTTNTIVDTLKISGKVPMQIIQMQDSSMWMADSVGGLMRREDEVNTAFFNPDGPSDPGCFDIIANNRVVYVAHGGFTDNYSTTNNHAGVSTLTSSGKWTYYRQYVYQPFDTLMDFVSVLKDQLTGTTYMGSFQDGLFQLNADGTYQLYRQNSIFDPSTAYFNNGQRQVAGMALDASDNLWVSTMYSVHQLYVRSAADSTWYKYYIPNSVYGGPVLIDDNGQVWYIAYLAGGTGGGVVVFNPNGTLADQTDDASYHLTTGVGYGNLPSNTVYCIAKDKNNAIWVGTNNGIGIVSNCYAPFNSSPPCDAELPIVQYDQYAGYLFAGSNVRTIAVDGANRKWVGTDQGIWLLSPDASTIVYRFTVDNSPLPSNTIRKIAIDPITGDVYIGTDQGMVSFRSTATEGGTSNSNVMVFPNPVKSGYTGTIAIKGLAANADVRITDISGELVYRTVALGGQAVWNGKDYTGHRPQSGVYLVFVSSSDGSQTYTGKIVFVQ